MNSHAREEGPGVATLDLYSLRYLEVLLGRPCSELKDLAERGTRYYKPFLLKKRERPFQRESAPAKKRLIDNPIDPLKTIQSRIDERLLKRLVLPEHLLGGVRGKSIMDNARVHLGARYLVTIDIKNFFPSITPQQVFKVWRSLLNCSPRVAYLLTGLTTLRNRLPQGAPTSTLLSNLVLSTFDAEIRAICNRNVVRYSSWIDDLAFSGECAHLIVGPVIKGLMKAGFRVSHQKIKVMGPGERKILNNLVLGRFATIQREYRSRIRAGIHNLECGRVAAAELGGYIESLQGSIGYLRLFDFKRALKLQEQLESASERVKATVGFT